MQPTATAPAMDARSRALSLAAVYACIFANGVGMGLSLPLLSLVMERAGASGSIIGLNAAFGAIAMMVATPLIPPIAGRIGALRFLLGCYVLGAVSLLAYRATDDIAAWFVLRFTLNCALQGFFLVSELWINQIATDRNRGTLIGIYSALIAAGFAIGPLIIQVMGTTGWGPFVAGAAMMSSAALPLIAARRTIPAIAHAHAASVIRFFGRSPTAMYAALCYGAMEICTASILPVYAVRTGSTEAEATLLMAAWGLGNLLLVPVVGWIADKMDRRRVLIGCGVIGVLGSLAIPLFGGALAPTLIVLFIWGGVIVGLYTVGLAYLGSKFKGEDLAAANAAFAFMYAAGAFVGPGIGGAAMDVWDPNGLFVALAVMAGLYVTLAAARYFRVSREAPPPA